MVKQLVDLLDAHADQLLQAIPFGELSCAVRRCLMEPTIRVNGDALPLEVFQLLRLRDLSQSW